MTPEAPVSCAPGTQFCLTVARDKANLVNGHIGEGVLVTNDAGQSWTGYKSLPAAFWQADAISCVSASACWAAGQDIHGEPQVAVTTDGGKTWTDKTPVAWADVTWLLTGISCPSASTCWMSGADNPSGELQEPVVIKTTDSGDDWTCSPTCRSSRPATPTGPTNSTPSRARPPRSCVAVGDRLVADGNSSIITTIDGGRTWQRTVLPRISTLTSVSCLPTRIGIGAAACFSAGAIQTGTSAGKSVILESRDGGVTWQRKQTFGFGANFPGNSLSCASATHCWVAWWAQTDALTGTASAGKTWSTAMTTDGVVEYGSVSCLSTSVCVATTDYGLWVTSDDGGLS